MNGDQILKALEKDPDASEGLRQIEQTYEEHGLPAERARRTVVGLMIAGAAAESQKSVRAVLDLYAKMGIPPQSLFRLQRSPLSMQLRRAGRGNKTNKE